MIFIGKDFPALSLQIIHVILGKEMSIQAIQLVSPVNVWQGRRLAESKCSVRILMGSLLNQITGE
jgi:hypothetical protein